MLSFAIQFKADEANMHLTHVRSHRRRHKTGAGK